MSTGWHWAKTPQARQWGICLGLALLQVMLFAGMQFYMGGQLSFPLDDSFIHMQYGKQIAQGEYFRYQDGEAVSGGATSFLYPHLLAVGYWLGFREERMVLWALLIALASIATLLSALQSMGARLAGGQAGWQAVALVWLTGSLGWAFWGGMEIALITALLFAALNEATRETTRVVCLALSLMVLAICRPEGSIMAAAIYALWWMRWFWQGKGGFPRRGWALLVGPPLAMLLPPLVNRITLGSWSGNSLVAKSLLQSPIHTWQEKAAGVMSNLAEILTYLSGVGVYATRLGEYVPPLLLPLALIGLGALLWGRQAHSRWQGLYLGVPLAIVIPAVASLEVWQLHNYRYLAPLLPLLILLAVVALWQLSRLIRLSQANAFAVTLLCLILASHFPSWLLRYSQEAAVIYQKQTRTAQWINQNLPQQGSVAINDAGVLAYYGEKPIYDLVGLVSNEPTRAYRMGEGSLFETLERLPAGDRPQYAAVFPSWFEKMQGMFDIFYRPLVTFPDPFDSGFGKVVYEINWNYASYNDQPRQATMAPGWRVVDALDVGDLVSEQQHNYQLAFREGRYPEGANPFRRNFGYHEEIDERWPGIENEVEELIPKLWSDGTIYQYDIADAGRRVQGTESFTFSGLNPQEDMHLILRTCDETGEGEAFAYRMAVSVNGIYLGEWQVSGTPWNWYETVFTIPAEQVEKSLRIEVATVGTPGYPYHDSYYYWAAQSERVSDQGIAQR